MSRSIHVALSLLLVAPVLGSDPLEAQTRYSEARAVFSSLGYGSAVATAAGTLFVSEPGRIMGPAVVFAYERGGAGWIEAEQLTSTDGAPGDGFGSLLAAGEGVLLVSAPAGGDGRGAVHVFERGEDGVWAEETMLLPDPLARFPGFGTAAAVEGDLAVIGWGPYGEFVGRAEVYRRDESGWSLTASLSAPDSTGPSAFGAAVAIDGRRVFVGAPIADEFRGAVFTYLMSEDGTAELEGAMTPRGLLPNALYGVTVHAEGNRAAASAPNRSFSAGTVYAFEWDDESGAWGEASAITSPDGAQRDAYGSSIAVSESEIWVGAPGADRSRGATYLFRAPADSSGWTHDTTLSALEPAVGDGFSVSLAVDDGIAVISSLGRDNGAGAATVFERAEGVWGVTAELASEAEGLPAVEGGEIDCAADGRAGAFECSEVDLVSFLPVSALGGGRGIQMNDLWGWVDPESGRHYAIVGRTDGTAFVDVTDVEQPVYLGELPRTEGTPVADWRDVKVYRDHAYIVADGSPGHGMQIFDLTRLRDYDGEPVLFEEDGRYEGMSSAHNVVINEESGFAYVVGADGGGETCGGGLHMVDIREPLNPVFAGCFADPLTGSSNTGYSHDAQCVIYSGPDEEHSGKEICFGANETALSIADVTDKANPLALSRAAYPAVAYAHQGWLTDDHRYFYLGDELDESNSEDPRTRTLIWDVADLDDPVLVGEYVAETVATDHNLYVRGNLMYQSNYEAGLRILDISDPENPVEVAYFDTVPYREDTPEMSGSWTNYPFFDNGVILVTSRWEGLFILRKREPIT